MSLPKRMKMPNYLLLRSNKKSGPYSLQELISFGLKAYDLVWVEGKSASWRYPSEVEELKPYAPTVEEQPYDRFYKKKTEEVKEKPILVQEKPVLADTTLAYQPKPIVEQKPVFEEQPVVQQTPVEEKYEKYIPKKSVFVTLPGNKTVVTQKPVEYTPPPVPQPEMPAQTITVKENPEAQIKYSQPLDEIKEMYVKTLQERKSRIARKGFMLANVKRAAVIVGLVATGVIAGLIINRGSGKSNTLSQQSVQLPGTSSVITNKEAAPVDQSNNQPANSNEVNNNQVTQQSPIENNPSVVAPLQQQNEITPKVKEQLLRQEEQHEQERILNSRRETGGVKPPVTRQVYEEKPLQTDPRTGERNRNVRSENDVMVEERPSSTAKATMKPSKKSGLESLVSVTSNDYKRVAFGGIRNLEITVTNDSRFVLDKVTVELQYLKPSEEPLRTELIQFHSVSPNGAMTMKIRDTNRGIKVAYKIVDIQTAQQETALNGF